MIMKNKITYFQMREHIYNDILPYITTLICRSVGSMVSHM